MDGILIDFNSGQLSREVPAANIEIVIQVQNVAEIYVRYPESLLSGLSKIGGILALMKIWGLL